VLAKINLPQLIRRLPDVCVAIYDHRLGILRAARDASKRQAALD